MNEVGLALLSSASFAASHVISKRGLSGGTSVSAGFMVIVASAWVVVLVPLVLEPPESVSVRAVVFFAVSGLFAPAVSRAAALAGVSVLGPSISVPIQQGLRPLIAVPAAMLLLGETLGLVPAIGLGAIVAGGWILSREPVQAERIVPLAGDEPNPLTSVSTGAQRGTQPRFRRGIAFPIAAAVGYATADLLVKAGLGSETDAVYAAPISIGTGFMVWSIAHIFPPVRSRFRLGRQAWWLAVSGTFMGIAILLLFHALARGDVSLVAPIIGTQPLFVMVLSAMLLRRMERLERSTVVAAMLVVIGTALVAW